MKNSSEWNRAFFRDRVKGRLDWPVLTEKLQGRVLPHIWCNSKPLTWAISMLLKLLFNDMVDAQSCAHYVLFLKSALLEENKKERALYKLFLLLLGPEIHNSKIDIRVLVLINFPFSVLYNHHGIINLCIFLSAKGGNNLSIAGIE